MLSKSFSRRDALKFGLLGSAALLLPFERRALTKDGLTANRLPATRIPAPYTTNFAVPPVLQPVAGTWDGQARYEVSQQLVGAQIVPGLNTPIYAYTGATKPASRFVGTYFDNGGPTPGPTIQCRRSENGRASDITVRQINRLQNQAWLYSEAPWTSTHLHGSCSLPEYDGYASDVTQPGQYKDYHYPNVQDARTLWYHDHGVHHTAQNAYMGLAAQYHLHDAVEDGLPIPKGEYDVPLILKDVMLDTSGKPIAENNSESGVYGDIILVNGKPWPNMKVERRKYRFRILNAAISRSFRLALSNGAPLTVIGCDGGLMPAPQDTADLRLGMAERYEVVIDFAKYPIGTKMQLKNLRPKNNIEYTNTDKIMQFEVVAEASSTENNQVPATLNPNKEVMDLADSPNLVHREFRFERSNGAWTVNGTTWENVINTGYKYTVAQPKYDSVEVWTLKNTSGGWFHPVHIHLVDFKILDRNGRAPFNYEKGPKDVVYVGENETVRVIMKFTNQVGRYMMHCHNLVHEDHDMMAQFEVVGGPNAPHDPVYADPARKL